MTPDQKTKRALRLAFSYERASVQLTAAQRLVMKTPPSDPLKVSNETSGFWLELRDAGDQTIYRRVMQNPIRYAAEFPTGESDRPLAWGELDEPRGTFFLLIPDLPGARAVVLFSSPLEQPDRGQPALELARFSLQQFQERKGG